MKDSTGPSALSPLANLSQSGGHLHLPPEEFYWAALDGSGSGLPTRPSREQLGYLFEAFLPVPIEEVQPAYATLGDRRYIACGMRREHLAEIAGGAITFAPSALPPFITEQFDTSKLNLLTGRFEPKQVTRLRRLWLAQVAATAVLCSVLVMFGFELRTSQMRDQANALRDARSDVYSRVLGVGAENRVGGQPLEIQLTAELRRLRQTRARPAVEAQLDDASVHLASLLGAWPEVDNLHAQTEYISISPGAVTVRTTLPGSGEAERFAEHLRQLAGWRLQQPQVTASSGTGGGGREAVQASLRFTPVAIPAGEQTARHEEERP